MRLVRHCNDRGGHVATRFRDLVAKVVLEMVRDIAERVIEHGCIVWACVVEDIVLDLFGTSLERSSSGRCCFGLRPSVAVTTISAPSSIVVAVVVVVAPGPLGSRDDWFDIAFVSHSLFRHVVKADH